MKPVLITLLMILSCAAGAETVTIDLDNLVGDYDSGFIDPNDAPRIRLQSFTIPPEVNSLESLQVVMSGTNIDGWRICEIDVGGGVVVQDTTSIVTQMRLVLTAPTLGGDCFFGGERMAGERPFQYCYQKACRGSKSEWDKGIVSIYLNRK